MNAEILKQAGVDHDRGVQRFMGDASLYDSLLASYLEDDTFAKLASAYARCDLAEAFFYVHTLKGLSANMDMRTLYTACCALTEVLRAEDVDGEAVSKNFEAVAEADRVLRDAIIRAGGV